MAVSRAQFQSGMTYEAYKAQMTRSREQLNDNERGLAIAPDDLQAFKDLARTLNVLGVWIERPQSVTRERELRHLALYQLHPEWGDPSTPVGELSEEVRAQIQAAGLSQRQMLESMSTGTLARVTIIYCAECGYEPETLALTGTLMKTFGNQLAAIELVPWYEGSFEVKVGHTLVHSMYRDAGFPDPGTIVDAVRAQLAQGSLKGGVH